MKRTRHILFLLFLFAQVLWAEVNVADSASLAFDQKVVKANGDPLKIAILNYNYGVFLDEEGDIQNSILHLQKTLDAGLSIPDDSLIAIAANYLGCIHWMEGNDSCSTAYLEQGLISAEHINNIRLIRIGKMNLCENYSSLGETEKGIQMGLEVLEIREKENITKDICYDYVIIGEVFESIGNYEKWENYIQKAYNLKDMPLCAKKIHTVKIYNNLGRIAEIQEEYDAALCYYDTSMQISKDIGFDQGVGIALQNSALILQIQNKFNRALTLAKESEQYLGDGPYFKIGTFNMKAELLHKLGQNSEALDLVNQNIENINIDVYSGLKQITLSLLFEINFDLEEYSAAYRWNDSLRAHEAKLRESENQQNTEELETKYQTEKKEQQIDLLSAENQIKRQRVILFIVISGSLLLLLGGVFLLYFRKKKQNIQKQDSLRQQLLRSQMNPHFLFNALGSIQNYMLNNDTKKAAEYLNNFASLTRAILEHSAAESVILDDEINSLHDYIKLEQMRLHHSFSYSIIFDESLELDFINIPPMLIQPFVENAIKHGLKNKEKDGDLTLIIEDKEDLLTISIRDNGEGFDVDSNPNKIHKSMAMDIFRKRISLLKKVHQKKANYAVDSTKGKGTRVLISIPIIEQ